MLANVGSLFGEVRGNDSGNGSLAQVDGSSVKWQSLVLECLQRAASFVDCHFNVLKLRSTKESQSVLKLATLQQFLLSLARLCYKHGPSEPTSAQA